MLSKAQQRISKAQLREVEAADALSRATQDRVKEEVCAYENAAEEIAAERKKKKKEEEIPLFIYKNPLSTLTITPSDPQPSCGVQVSVIIHADAANSIYG